MDFARERIEPESVVSADEAANWDLLDPGYEMRRINHSEAYSHGGAHTNLAESYFSHLRRKIGGQHLRVEGRYLETYAAHAACFEDHCRVTPNSGTRRIGQRLLPLNMTFRRQLAEVFPFPQDKTINRCKKTGLQFERTKHGNSGVPIETNAEHCRLDQWT